MNTDLIMLKIKGAILRDGPTQADFSRKINIWLPEPSDDEMINLNRLAKKQAVDIIMLPSGSMELIEDILDKALSFGLNSEEE